MATLFMCLYYHKSGKNSSLYLSFPKVYILLEGGTAMDFLVPREVQIANTIKDLPLCNRLTEAYGLSLTPTQMLALAERRIEALKATDRVEFGEGVLKKLIFAFRDSPYLSRQNYEETLTELQDIFYQFKIETHDRLSDDELIEKMKAAFDGRAQGTLELIERFLEPEEQETIEEDEDE